jgi:asparagine synthase (glutamine-hydrolysing)
MLWLGELLDHVDHDQRRLLGIDLYAGEPREVVALCLLSLILLCELAGLHLSRLARNVLEEFLDYDRRTRFVGEYMTKVDGGAMYYALEARSPFLDHELWNFAAALPFEIRLRNGVLKAVLRECARRHVGEDVATGSKRGFTVPVQRWLAGRWRPMFENCLVDSVLGQEGYIRAHAVREALTASAESSRTPMQLWYLYVLETWFRREHASVEAPILQVR